MRRRPIATTVFVVGISLPPLIGLITTRAAAEEIHYRWSGTFLPNGLDDPWSIGEEGLPFALQLKVGRASDDLALDVDTALFTVDEARLNVGGQEIPYVGEGFLDLTDDWSTSLDLLTFHGRFERNGVQSVVASLASLPVSAFQFFVPSETPPLFGRVANVLKSGTGGPLYGTTVESGKTIVGVPEPRAACQAWLAFGTLICSRVGHGGIGKYTLECSTGKKPTLAIRYAKARKPLFTRTCGEAPRRVLS